SAHEVMSALSEGAERPGYDLVRAYWARPGAFTAAGAATPAAAPAAAAAGSAAPAGAATAAAAAAATAAFDRAWRKWLHDGVVPNTAFAPKAVAVQANFASQAAPAGAGQGLEVVFRPDPTVYDGRFSNNAWLQEVPKSLTKLT